MLIVPTAAAVGWELVVDEEVVVVKEIDGDRMVVEYPDGSTRSIEIEREDTEDNSEELDGSEYEPDAEKED